MLVNCGRWRFGAIIVVSEGLLLADIVEKVGVAAGMKL